MKIYHYNHETQELIGEGIADESPLEPGVFLIPAHATEQEPPVPMAGQTRHYEMGVWAYKLVPVPPEPPVPTAAEIKAADNAKIQGKIAAIEAKQGRALREAALNRAGALARLETVDAQIAALRAQLVE